MNAKKPQENDEIVHIKKYANRRLYNMETSSYVTLDDLQELVKRNVNFVVRDAKTEEDLTRQILLQIILEQESGGTNILPVEMLRSLIRYYDTEMHQSLSEYLGNSMSLFTQNKEEMLEQFNGLGDWAKFQQQQTEWFNKTMEMMNPLKPGN